MSLDRFRSVDIRIDKADHYFMSSQFAKGGDYNGRTLVVQITNGGLIETQAGITVNLGWYHESIKNSGLEPFEVVDSAQGIFEIHYPREMLNPGRVTAVIQIIDGEIITETKNFVVQVEKSPIDETTIVSSNSFTVLQEALIKVNGWNARIDAVEADFIARANNLDTIYPIELNSVKQQLAQRAYKTIFLRSYLPITDLNTFIQTKINEGYNHFIIPVGMELTQTLVIEKIRNGEGSVPSGIVIEGEGGSNHINSGAPIHFVLNTGGIGILLRETHSVTLKNLNISDKNAVNPSTVGIAITRDSSYAGSSIANILKNITVSLRDTPTANKNNGTIGIYNNTGEITTYENLFITANIPVVLTGSDVFSLCPWNTYKNSNLDHYFVGNNYFFSWGGINSTVMYVEKSENIVGNVYLYTETNDVTSFGITADDWTAGNLNVDMEGIKNFLKLINNSILSVNFTGVLSNVDSVIVIQKGPNTTGIDSCSFHFYTAWNGKKTFLNLGAGAYFQTNKITLSSVDDNSVFDIYGAYLGNYILSTGQPVVNLLGDRYSSIGNLYHTKAGMKYENKRRIGFEYGLPSESGDYSPYFSGDIFFNTDIGDTGSPVGRVRVSQNTWNNFGQQGYRSILTSSIPTAIPKQKGEIIFDENNNAWIAYGTAVGQFKQMT